MSAFRNRFLFALLNLSICFYLPVWGQSGTLPARAEPRAGMPAHFQENKGQWDEPVRFRGRFNGVMVSFLPDGVSHCLARESEEEEEWVEGECRAAREFLVWNTVFCNMNKNVNIYGEGRQSSFCNYFLGNDPSRWVVDAPAYTAVVYEGLYDFTDARYYACEGALKYDLILHPGADISDVQFSFAGAEAVSIGEEGQLLVTTAWGVETEAPPISYQEINGAKEEVEVRYQLNPGQKIGFEITGPYNPAYDLVIDPLTLRWGTYMNATGTNPYSYATAMDAAKNIYITGYCVVGYPTTPGVFQTVCGGSDDTYVTKLNRSGTALIFSTYLGGSQQESGNAIEVDATGNIYLTGSTISANFPVQGAFQATNGGTTDAFVTKLNPTGTALIYSTYIGGTSNEYSRSIAVSSTGEAYITGETFSTNYDIVAGSYLTTATAGSPDGFITKFSSAGNTLVYSSYLGGTSNDYPRVVKVNAAGNAFIGGYTFSTGFPTTVGAAQTIHAGGVYDIFVTKMNPAGNGLVYSTFIGGSGIDVLGEAGGGRAGNQMALNSSDEIYITGFTSSSNFPVSAGAMQTVYAGSDDVFVTKLNAAGSARIYSTYMGGAAGSEHSMGLVVNGAGQAYVSGYTTAGGFPGTGGNFQPTYAGSYEMFLFHLNATGTGLACGGSTYVGGTAGDYFNPTLLLDLSGAVDTIVVSGTTHSSNFPAITAGSYQTAHTNGTDDEPVVFKMYSCASVLPLDINSFSGRYDGGRVLLNWISPSANVEDEFQVERSTDHQVFSAIARVHGKEFFPEPGQFSLKDEHPFAGVNYYRLRKKAPDGNSVYSEVISVFAPEGSIGWILFPNPVSTQLTCEFRSQQEQEVSVRIENVTGETVAELGILKTNSVFQADVSQLAQGVYFICAGSCRARFIKS